MKKVIALRVFVKSWSKAYTHLSNIYMCMKKEFTVCLQGIILCVQRLIINQSIHLTPNFSKTLVIINIQNI